MNTEPLWPNQPHQKNKKRETLDDFPSGPDETRTRDPMRDRHVF